jgi:Nif-specific regulatory protein
MKLNLEAGLDDLLELLSKISSETQLSDLLVFIAKETSKFVDCEKASVFLLNQDKNELWSKTTLDGSTITFDSRLGIAGEAVSNKTTLRINDVQNYKNFHRGIDSQTGYETKKIIVVPLLDRSENVLGTFQMLNKIKGDFTASDEKLAETIAKQISVAVENAKTFEIYNTNERELNAENSRLKKELNTKYSTKNILGSSTHIQNMIRLIEQISEVQIDVLITGESGTGKELIAKAIHYSSAFYDKPFISLNCAAIPENLFESELFGIEKGVATGVDKKQGKFELANGGTLFLDEIGDLSPMNQAKILRALQERVIQRVGGNNDIPINVRVIAATNKNLESEIQSGNFREDLFFRLKVIHIQTPSLRSIPEDIPILAYSFIDRFCKDMNRREKKFSKSAMDAMTSYSWPGNIRELENEVKRLSVICHGSIIKKEDLSPGIKEVSNLNNCNRSVSLKKAVETLEITMIKQALEINKNNKQQTANYLGLSRWGLMKKIKRYGLTN